MSVVELMAAPFAECLILVAIHTYLGLHVLKRRVIFVDLALAQMAALGTTVGFLFGILPDTVGSLIYSMAFAFVGAGVFAVTRFRQERVPQEAVIGVAYAISCAIAVLVVEKTRGAEHLKDILVGNLLWVTWSDVLLAASVYLAVGVIHFLFRRQLFLISEDPDQAYRSGLWVRGWDFLFYLTFGVVIALSTRVAGVLLVFVFLVAPGILAFLVTGNTRLQLLIGWVTGTVVTVLGLYLSWVLDLPSGPAVISLYGVALVLGATALLIVRSRQRWRTLSWVGLGTAVTLLVGLALWAGGRSLGSSEVSVSESAREVENGIVEQHARDLGQQVVAADERRAALAAHLGKCARPADLDKHLSLTDPEAQLQHVRQELKVNRQRGLVYLLIALADEDLPLLYREEGVELLEQAAGQGFGYDAQSEVKSNTPAIRRICEYLQTPESRHGS